jgi:GntR family transcriptional regulator, transcriptional repressor for pyruvate dehydrogenase complex
MHHLKRGPFAEQPPHEQSRAPCGAGSYNHIGPHRISFLTGRSRTREYLIRALTRGKVRFISGLFVGPVKVPTPAKFDFEVVRKGKVYEEVAKQIERLILKKLKPGDKLPSERDLVETLQVSRSSIRDAIRGLELVGMVEPRQGAGTIVRELATDSITNPFADALKRRQKSVGELLDFREMLEPPLAARAAMHATADEISEMEEILQRQEDKQEQGEVTIAEDAEFHYSVALASGNGVVLKVLDILMELLRDTRERSLQVKGRSQKSIAGHRRILAAIKRRDAEAAKAAMRRHIKDIEEIVLRRF